jgi:hypothetical protein
MKVAECSHCSPLKHATNLSSLNVRIQFHCYVIVTAVQTHANLLELTDLVVKVVEERRGHSMSEYDDEVLDEEQDCGDLDDTSEYDDLDLP